MPFKHVTCCIAIGIVAACTGNAHAAWRTVGRVVAEQHTQHEVELSTASGAHVRIWLVNANVVRVRMSPSGTFERDFSYAIANPHPAPTLNVAPRDGGIEV